MNEITKISIMFSALLYIDLHEVERLAREWDMTTEELLEQMHEASEDEIAEYGIWYDEIEY